MKAGEAKPLSISISMYCGSVTITGQVAPWQWWYDAAEHHLNEQLKATISHLKGKHSAEQEASLRGAHARMIADLQLARSVHVEAQDEVTLFEVTVMPSVGTAGTQSGGHTLPVARIPLSSIDAWWIVSGRTIPGQGHTSFGMLIPIPLPF